MTRTLAAILLATTAGLTACATTPRTGPAQVVRFVDPGAQAMLGQGTIAVLTAPGENAADGFELAAFKAAVARELQALGYREAARGGAGQIAEVGLERFADGVAVRRGGSGVNVGVGGSTGTYGSGVGVGVGINLGGGRGAREVVGTELAVRIRDAGDGRVLWEGRASFDADARSPLADRRAAAEALTDALFARFPAPTDGPVSVELRR